MKFEWKGNLADDCTCVAGNMHAHAEWMDGKRWYCNVCVTAGKKRIFLFNSPDENLMFFSGDAARKFCEFVMRAYLAGVVWNA